MVTKRVTAEIDSGTPADVFDKIVEALFSFEPYLKAVHLEEGQDGEG